MDIVFILLPLSLVLATIFVWLFVKAALSGQFDDLDDPAQRILDDDD